MEDKYIAILGGLVGSAITLIMTKIFDYFQTKQLHRLALKKEFFLRKLHVFEKSVSYMTIAHTSITNMAVILKTALNDKVTFTDEQSKGIFSSLEKNIDRIYEATQETAGSIDLYVDLKHDDREVEAAQQFWELLGTINQLGQDASHGYDLLGSAKSKEEYQIIRTSIDIITKDIEANIEKLVALSNSMRGKYLGITTMLREQLRKYE